MGNGYEYRRIEEMPASFMIIPLNFPAKPEVADPQNALQYSTEQLKHWDMAPDNAAKLADAGFQFALTSAELKDRKDFRNILSRAVNRGLNESAALAALTTNPAKEFGQAKRLGKVAPGFIANLVVTDGNYFDKKSKVQSVWIDGNEYEVAPDPLVDAVGDWTLREGSNSWTLSVKTDGGSLNVDEKKLKLANYKLDQDRISFSVNADTILQKGVTRFKGTITGGKATGYVFLSLIHI